MLILDQGINKEATIGQQTDETEFGRVYSSLCWPLVKAFKDVLQLKLRPEV